MHKSRRNQDASSKMFCAEEERCRYTKTRKFDDQDRESAGSRRDEEDDEKASDMEG